MAAPVAPRGCLLKFLITIVVIVALIAVAAIVVINLTPDQLGLADIEIFDGNTLRDLGLHDVKLKDLYGEFMAIMEPDAEKIVTNGYDKKTETTVASGNVDKSSIKEKADGTPDYSSIVSEPLTYDKKYLLEYKDTTLAYVFNAVIADSADAAEGAGADTESLDYLRSLGIEIDEVTIVAGGATNTLRIVASIDLTSIKSEVETALGALASYVTLPERVYIVSYSEISADADGKVVTVSKSLKINDADNKIADAIFKVLADKAAEMTEGEAGDVNDSDYVNGKVGEAFSEFMTRLGKVGTATVDGDGVVTGDEVLGSQGISNHKITVITNTAE